MSFLRSVTSVDTGPVVVAGSIYLRMPGSSDYAPWAELRARSRDFLVPWEPTWARDELTRSAYKRRLRQYQKDLREEAGYAFFMFRKSDNGLLGGLSLSNIRRGVTQACTLGYWMGLPHAGHGYMTEAVQALAPFVFNTLWLHRLEAACLPGNRASIRVLEKCGFEREGLARSYLKINGIWQDHVLYGLISDSVSR